MPVYSREGVPPFAEYVPGADSDENDSRRQGVRAATVHTTQGRDSRSLGSGRHHNTPGTFNFLIRLGVVYCYYPAWVRCSHAAGGNHAGPGIEIDMYTGEPVSDENLLALGRLIIWLHENYGLPLTYRTGDPRLYLDNSDYRGFIAHRGIDYPPDRSLLHYDQILEPPEFSRAIGLAVGPAPEVQEEDMPDHVVVVKDTQDPAQVANVLVQDHPFGIVKWYSGAHVGFAVQADALVPITVFGRKLLKPEEFVKLPIAPPDTRLARLVAWLAKVLPTTKKVKENPPPEL